MYFINNIVSSDIDKIFNFSNPEDVFMYGLITPIKWLINLIIDFFGLTYENDKNILALIVFGASAFMIGFWISIIKYTIIRIVKNTAVMADKISNSDKDKKKCKKYYILKDMIDEDIKNGRDLDMGKYQEYADKNHLDAFTANQQGVGYYD